MTLSVIEVYGIMKNLCIQKSRQSRVVECSFGVHVSVRMVSASGHVVRSEWEANGICGDKISIAGEGARMAAHSKLKKATEWGGIGRLFGEFCYRG